jgi:hypothetical protein
VRGQLARSDRGRERFLRGDPAFALRRAGCGCEPLRLVGGRAERRIAAVCLIDQFGQAGGQRRRDRPIVHRPLDRHARVDRFGRTRLERRVGAARRCAGGQRDDDGDDGCRADHRSTV